MNKESTRKGRAPIQPLELPEKPWTDISMDFITSLPLARNCDSIFVVVDRFSKMAHFIGTRMDVTAEDVADLFLREVVRHHGLPKRIVSDRDPKFTSKFWTSLFEYLGTSLKLSTAAHPETDGQTERTNRTFEVMIRHFVAGRLTSWVDFLPNLEFAYNAAIHSSTGKSPFALNYLYLPQSPLDAVLGVTENETVEEMRLALEEAKDAITEAQRDQAVQSNKHRILKEFEVGEFVLLSTKHLDIHFRERAGHKLFAPYLGPFEVLERIGPVAYRLKLPETLGRTHNVFYVGLLKPFDRSRWDPTSVQSIPDAEGVPTFKVDAVLKKRINRRSKSRVEYFVRWKGLPETDGTWEPAEELLKDVPGLIEEFEAERNARIRRSGRKK
jgi:hypothetical protein